MSAEQEPAHLTFEGVGQAEDDDLGGLFANGNGTQDSCISPQ